METFINQNQIRDKNQNPVQSKGVSEEKETVCNNTEAKLPAADDCESPAAYKGGTRTIISKVAYLIGVPKKVFEHEFEPPDINIYNQLEGDKNARIIRNLCRLRTSIEKHFGKIAAIMHSEYRGLASIHEYIPSDCITQLIEDGIHIKGNQKLALHIIDLNKMIADRINNCKDIFPIWINWLYIRNLFIMPDGASEEGIKKAADVYYEYFQCYPYQVYINWQPSNEGNILFNDEKFLILLYRMNKDEFKDFSKVSDASSFIKNSIYDFIEASGKTVFVVDCENSDPYKLCATFKNLDPRYVEKISKIILFDDVHTASAWRIMEKFVPITVEYKLIDRVKQNKSIVDISLTAVTCKEFYQNNADSFVLASSDSDYWGLIKEMPAAKFLVMVEREKTGFDIKNAFIRSGIFYCYIDNFYTGNSDDIKMFALLKEMRLYLDRAVSLNVNSMMDAVFRTTRIEMSEAERKQFYNKYIKSMFIDIDEEGNLSLQLKGIKTFAES